MRAGPEDLLFPHWMFAYVRSTPAVASDGEELPPLISKTGIVHEHGTQRAADGELTKARIWRRDGSEFLMADVWGCFWNTAREAAGLPKSFTPYNARHTGISWAIDKRVDLQKVRQHAGHGSLEVTSRYTAILDERDTNLAEVLEEIFDTAQSDARRLGGTTPEVDDTDKLRSIDAE